MSENEFDENIQVITTELCMILGVDSIDNISKEDAIRELCKIIISKNILIALLANINKKD